MPRQSDARSLEEPVELPVFVPRVDPRPDADPWLTAVVWPVPVGTVLRGSHVELRVSEPANDSQELFSALDSGEVWAHVGGRPSDAAAVAGLINQRLADPAWCPWTVRLLDPPAGLTAGAVVGSSSYLDVAAGDARGEIGSTSYAPAVWGSAVNPECKLLLLEYAFQTLGFGRVQLKTDIRNHRSQQAIARLGAHYEGTLRRYQRRADGSTRDTVLFSITAEEWPSVQARLQQRLAAYPA
jgi:RimJ/RimL family protein N-acetyltransferase